MGRGPRHSGEKDAVFCHLCMEVWVRPHIGQPQAAMSRCGFCATAQAKGTSELCSRAPALSRLPQSPQEHDRTGKEYIGLCHQSGRFPAAGLGSRESSPG